MKILVLAATCAALAASPAFAQVTDGDLSQTASASTFNVTTVIPKMVRISGLEDITLNITAAQVSNSAGAQTPSQRFCVYSNDTADGLYKISVGGVTSAVASTTEEKFAIAGPGGSLPFGVWVSDQASNPWGGSNAVPGSFYNKKTTAGGQSRPTTLNCNGVENASLALKINNSRILAALQGSYTGQLTITVAPQ